MVGDNLTPEQAAKAHELNIRAAETVHDQSYAYFARMSDQVMKDAWATLRTLVLINGTSFIVWILALYIGQFHERAGPTALFRIVKDGTMF